MTTETFFRVGQTLCATAMLCLGLGAVRLDAAAFQSFECGDAVVYPIQEAETTFSRELFADDAETVAKLNEAFPRPAAPASINAFLVNVDKKWILIDTGIASKESTIMTTLEQLRITATNIDMVILTHNHPDHTGNLLDSYGRPKFPRAVVWVPAADMKAARLLSPKPEPQLKRITEGYIKRVKSYRDGKVFVPGLVAVDAPGHTPGHSALLLNDKGLFIGDLIHAAKWQFPYPELCTKYDADPEQAIESRKALLDQAAEKQWMIFGAHLPYPGTGSLNKKDGGYQFMSQEYAK